MYYSTEIFDDGEYIVVHGPIFGSDYYYCWPSAAAATTACCYCTGARAHPCSTGTPNNAVCWCY